MFYSRISHKFHPIRIYIINTMIFKESITHYLMKKLFSLTIATMFMFSFGLVSAATLITGTVYQYPDITNPIEGAEVVVSCVQAPLSQPTSVQQ